MLTLGIDVGSSSVKAGLLRGTEIVSKLGRASYPTRFDGPCVEVEPRAVLKAIASAISDLGKSVGKIDCVALSVMAPAWLAMDAAGKPLTRLVTHQDRRSVAVAEELERRVGKGHFLSVAGNRPFPGGISATTARWFVENHPELIKKADLIGHLNTFLVRTLTGGRVIDESNASFTGLFNTVSRSGWADDIVEAVGLKREQLPDVLEADVIGGRVTRQAARSFGLPAGVPVVCGLIDTSSAMLLTGAKTGQLLNVMGSTDVLALCADHAAPHERLLTRAIGVGARWMSVSTLAAAGSALSWAQKNFFADLKTDDFYKLLPKLAKAGAGPDPLVQFEPYLAGERTSIEQKRAAFSGLTLGTSREQMLTALIDALARASAARLPLLEQRGTTVLRSVRLSGGSAKTLAKIFHRDWPGKWSFGVDDESTLRGLGTLVPRERP